jgi:hypothetical protein
MKIPLTAGSSLEPLFPQRKYEIRLSVKGRKNEGLDNQHPSSEQEKVQRLSERSRVNRKAGHLTTLNLVW